MNLLIFADMKNKTFGMLMVAVAVFVLFPLSAWWFENAFNTRYVPLSEVYIMFGGIYVLAISFIVLFFGISYFNKN